MLLRSNPLLGLSVSQAQALYDAARVSHGSSPLLQRVYAEVESVDPVLLTCVERRSAALSGMGWSIEVAGDGGPDADAQRAAVEDFVGAIENLDEALEHLGLAFFRGYSFAQPIWERDTVLRIEPLQSWNVVWGDGQWRWNPDCQPTADGLEAIGGDVLRVFCRRAIDYPALFIYLRHHLAERDWGRYVERYGIPPVDAIMASTATEQDRPAYEDAADAARDGVSVVWPSGTSVTRADSSRGSDPFSALIDHQEKLLVLMATGGTLTSLAQADTGTLAGGAQMDVWRQIVSRISTVISGALHRGLVLPFLSRRFPGEAPLVRFALGKTSNPTPQELLDMAGKAKTAGYTLDQTDLERGTGLKFERDPQTSSPMGGVPFPNAVIRNADAPAQDFSASGRENDFADEAMRALASDLGPVRDAVASLLEADARDLAQRAEVVAKRIPDLPPPQCALQDVIGEAMTLGVLEAIAGHQNAAQNSGTAARRESGRSLSRSEASKPVANPLQNVSDSPRG